eukprot:SAG11_NODE_1594_length_4612_cov_11.187458_2_plen_43_part_00
MIVRVSRPNEHLHTYLEYYLRVLSAQQTWDDACQLALDLIRT